MLHLPQKIRTLIVVRNPSKDSQNLQTQKHQSIENIINVKKLWFDLSKK